MLCDGGQIRAGGLRPVNGTHFASVTSSRGTHIAGTGAPAVDGGFRAFVVELPPAVVLRLAGPPTGAGWLSDLDARHGGAAPPPSKMTH